MFALIAITALAQAGPLVLPAGSSEEFLKQAHALEAALASRDFVSATKLAKKLPHSNLRLKWNDSEVPAKSRASLATERDAALAMWRSSAGIHISLVSEDADVEMDLSRAQTRSSHRVAWHGASKASIHNQVAFLVGRELGLISHPAGSSVMSAPGPNDTTRKKLQPSEVRVVLSTLRSSNVLREGVRMKRITGLARPISAVLPTAFRLSSVVQGNEAELNLRVANEGASPLEVLISPDCSCVAVARHTVVEPRSSQTLAFKLDALKMQPGTANHRLELLTNDPKATRIVVPIEAEIEPLIVWSKKPNEVIAVNKWPVTLTAEFALHPSTSVIAARLDGAEGTVQLKRLPGSARYRVQATIPGPLASGSHEGRIELLLDHERIPLSTLPFQLATGAWAVPSNLYLGRLSSGDRKLGLIVRGAKPFRLLGVKSSLAEVTVPMLPSGSSKSHRVALRFRKSAQTGRLTGKLVFKTDLPGADSVTVEMRGVVE